MGIADRDYMRSPRRDGPSGSDEPERKPGGLFRGVMALIGLILLIAFLAYVFGVR